MSGYLTIPPNNPNRPYLHPRRKLKMRLQALEQVTMPDARTRADIADLRRQLNANLQSSKRRAR